MHSARTLSSHRTRGQDNRTCPRGLSATLSHVLLNQFPRQQLVGGRVDNAATWQPPHPLPRPKTPLP